MALLPVPGLPVEFPQEVEGIEPEVPGAAGGVEQLDGARLAQACGRLGLLGRLYQQELAAPAQPGLPSPPVEPESPERVVDQELHHITRGEELVAHGQLAAVAWRLGGLAHRFALFLRVEVLVDP